MIEFLPGERQKSIQIIQSSFFFFSEKFGFGSSQKKHHPNEELKQNICFLYAFNLLFKKGEKQIRKHELLWETRQLPRE